MNSHQNKNQHTSSSPSHRPGLVHSTHSHLETFDQATRDSQLEQESLSSSSAQFSSETMAAPTLQDGVNSEGTLREANSAVQLDRDVQHSRKIADENRQKASGNARSAPVDNQNELSYVE
ncbi:hypothetical protein CPC16_009033 [Podila verticillata]|nr:hypothetical protein BGZ52_007302 [Haplosporangium bisporale]KAF9211894.1 hypothetical protein BGZ59_007472 [Podila verticillata]KAF9383185.1 hypothetical protein CPC16_009033 [Podila verticillata]KFH68740.1 hypothetical protein MVEG_05547 [Podila verticillata NRRL 6337]